MIDTHTHLYLDDFATTAGVDGADAVNRALQAGVSHMVFPAIDAASVAPMRRLHQQFPESTSMAIGLHPTEVNDEAPDIQLEYVIQELANNPNEYVAIGEIGIDLYWDKSREDKQMQIFEKQLIVAARHNLPVIIHCRDGLDNVLEVIDGLQTIPQCVFHSFGGSIDDVEQIRRRGDFFFGINGIVTFKNSSLRTVLPEIGIDRLLLETDSPYLAPVPMRGRRNESSYIIHTAAHIAQHLNIDIATLDSITTATAQKFFKL